MVKTWQRRLARLVAGALLACPLLATAQQSPAVQAGTATADQSAMAGTSQAGGWVLPLWRAADGRWMALALSPEHRPTSDSTDSATRLQLVDATPLLKSGMHWTVAPNLVARAGVRQKMLAPGSTCDFTSINPDCSQSPSWTGGELGAGLRTHDFALDLGVNWLEHNPDEDSAGALVAPTAYAAPGLLGFSPNLVDSMGGVNARGSMRLGTSDTSISLGAGLGRLSLVPGSGLGLGAIDQKSLSLGVGTGPISGLIVGRVMESDKLRNPLARNNARWSAIDLGVTWQLPWDGELKVGAQNVWSNGAAPLPQAIDTDPSQRRVPYIQYHQEL